MSDEIYHKLAKTLDSLPNGFPATESGLEIKILKKIFRPEDIELFCELKLNFETAEQIAERTGRPQKELEEHLDYMWNRGQIFGVDLGGVKLFKMMPWVFGIYELQMPHLDKELAELTHEYLPIFGKQFLKDTPQFMRTIPIEKEISAQQEALSYDKVSNIIEKSESFLLMDCICKKEKKLLDDGCDKPLEICMGFAPIPNVFDNYTMGKSISKEEAYAALKKAEEAGLVHLTWNLEADHTFICNCCGCCCGILRGINDYKFDPEFVVNSAYYAEIDPDKCQACGVCKEDRCQINDAIEEGDESYNVVRKFCIGCGLCVTDCPEEAIQLKAKSNEELAPAAKNEMDWYQKRAEARGLDIKAFTTE